MIERFRRTVVDSYVGAIALGYVLAQAILHLAGTASAPFEDWAFRRVAAGSRLHYPSHWLLLTSLSELTASFLLGLLWYLVFRWLYLRPSPKEPPA
jgi:hypothetical protein